MSGNDLFIPPEIWYQILTKLPVKSVVRFRCVCKTCQSLISGPNFISDRGYKRVLVSRYDGVNNLYKFSCHDESFVESHGLEHDVMSGYNDGMGSNIVGSCDGLICLREGTRYLESFLIWNPSFQKIVKLPSHFSDYSSSYQRESDCVYGFGFDSIASDYKLLRVHPTEYNDGLGYQIFDLRKGVWRSVIPPNPTLPSYSYVEKSRSSLYLHGHLHWIGYDLHSHCILLSFNLSTEAFREMELPGDADFEKLDFHSWLCFSNVSLINGLLSVAVFRRPLQSDAPQGCSVWSMKEYGVTESWTKLYHIDLPCRLYRWDFSGFSGNAELLITTWDRVKIREAVLALYNPKSKESKALLPAKYLLDVCLTMRVSFYHEDHESNEMIGDGYESFSS